MPMSGSGLAAAIQAIPGINITNEAELTAFCNAVVTYITTNAVVPLGIAVQVSPSSGTGATTAPGTVT